MKIDEIEKEKGKWKIENGRWKSYRMRRGPLFSFLFLFVCFLFCFVCLFFVFLVLVLVCFVLFCFVFFFLLFKPTKICFGSTKMEIFYREKAFHAGKNQEKRLCPLRKNSCYAHGHRSPVLLFTRRYKY